MDRVLVVGATGNVGREVLSQLASAGAPVRALTREPDAVAFPPRTEVVRGDLTLPDTLEGCLDGIDTVFLVWTAPAGAVVPALERITRHARRIVFLSAPLKTPHPLFQQPNPLRAMVEQIERLIVASGREWTFLRPGMYASNALGWWAPRFASATWCVGRMRSSPRRRSMNETSAPSRSARSARTDTRERTMF